MNSLTRSDVPKFLLDLCGYSKVFEDKEQSKTAAITVDKAATSALSELRRSSRTRRPSRKVRESIRDSGAADKVNKLQKKRKKYLEEDTEESESIEKHKKLCIITDVNHLHHYPISNPDIDDVLTTLQDQKKEIKKLTKREIAELDSAIKLSKETGAYPGVQISLLGSRLGNGAFLDPSANPLSAGTVLGIYSGEYKLYQIDHLDDIDLSYAFELTDIICLDKQEHLKFFGNLDTYVEDGDYVIYSDAYRKGNWTRNLNHGGRYANCTAELVRYKTTTETGGKIEQWIVLVKTSKKINPGEQLLFDYGKHYWQKYGIVPTAMKPSTYKMGLDGHVTNL